MTPKRFVGLHSHSISIGDSLGLPPEHMDFVLKNGGDALAITDHGNMSALSHQYLHQKKLDQKGVPFLSIYGNEMYAIESLGNWREEKAKHEAQQVLAKNNKADAKKRKDSASALRALRGDVGLSAKEQNELQQLMHLTPDPAEQEIKEITNELGLKLTNDDDSDEGGTIVENEEESKDVEGAKKQNPLRKRGHLVLLAKNSAGLKALFELTSRSFKEGFYYFPRTDIKMLRELSNGNLIGLSACISGVESRVVFENQESSDWQLWHTAGTQKPDTFERVQAALKRSVEQYIEALGEENFFLELQQNSLPGQHLVNMHLLEASKRLGVKLVSTADAHYPNPAQWKEREIYRMMAQLSKNPKAFSKEAIPQTIEELKCELYPKNAEQMWAAYHKYGKNKYDFYDAEADRLVCESIERTHDIAHLVIGKIEPDKRIKLPAIKQLVADSESVDETKDEDVVAFKELVRLSIEGMKKRGKDTNPQYITRLKKELDIVKHLKQSKYFLTCYKLVNECKKEMLIGAGRGSASGSLLLWALGITQVDSIRFGLIVERVLTKHKVGASDVDLDFSDRDYAVKIIKRVFGENNVIPVSNFSQFQLKSLIKDLARLNGIAFEEINPLTKNIEIEVLAEQKKTPGFDRGTYVMVYEDAAKYSPSFKKIIERWPELNGPIAVLFKQIKGIGRHAGGAIITQDAERNLPLVVSGKGDSKSYQTPFSEGVNFRHLEEFGFLKFDILGVATLKMFENAIKRILQRHDNIPNPTFDQIKEFYYTHLDPDNQTFTDERVYEHVYWNKTFCNIFQFINPGAQKFVSEMRPVSIVDLAIATSIFRPGALAAGVDKLFLENRRNPDEVEYLHPLMKDALADSSGCVIFQEDLQILFHKLAGIPLDETDKVRKAFTKKEISNIEKAKKDRKELGEKFSDDCLATNNIPRHTSQEIFDYLLNYASYGFNKAHAVSYAIMSWQTAWLLTYFEPEWAATYLDHAMSDGAEAKALAVLEVKKLGYGLGKPDINFSDAGWAINDSIKASGKPTLVASFSAIKGIGEAAIEEIKLNRPYRTAYDLLVDEKTGKWRHSKFNRKSLSSLIQIGAFESMDLVGLGKVFENYRQMHTVLIDNFDILKKNTTLKKKTQTFKELFDAILAKVKAEDAKDWSMDEKIKSSIALLGNVDIDLIVPFDLRAKLAAKNIPSIDSYEKENGIYWAIVQSTEIAYTKNNDPYMRMKLMGEANAEHTCFVWQRNDDDKVTSIHLPPYSVIILTLKQKEWNERLSFETKVKKIRKVV